MSRVLVVDDEPDVRLMLRLALGLAGHEVGEADNGEHAIEALSLSDYEGVILDVHLPDMTGWEVLERLRDSPVRGRTPVVVVTADITQGEGEMARAYRSEISDLLFKPMDPDLLVSAIESVMAPHA